MSPSDCLPWISQMRNVPYYAQVASPDLAEAIFSGRMDAREDPAWPAWGATTPEEYAYWTRRACGAVCVKMAVEAMGGPVRPLMEIIRKGTNLGAYGFERNEETGAEKGWLHRGLVDMLVDAGFSGQAVPAELSDILDLLHQEELVIASVSAELGRDGPITRQRGHLVLLLGIGCRNAQVDTIVLHNPSGRTADLRANAKIPLQRFTQAYSGRIILVQNGLEDSSN